MNPAIEQKLHIYHDSLYLMISSLPKLQKTYVLNKEMNYFLQTRSADVLVVGAGKTRLVTGDMVKPGAIVIDCGINYGEEKNGKRELSLYFNFHF